MKQPAHPVCFLSSLCLWHGDMTCCLAALLGQHGQLIPEQG